MPLLIVIGILIVWAVKGIYDATRPQIHDLGDLDEHLRVIHSLPDQRSRRKYLNNMAKQQNRRR